MDPKKFKGPEVTNFVDVQIGKVGINLFTFKHKIRDGCNSKKIWVNNFRINLYRQKLFI